MRIFIAAALSIGLIVPAFAAEPDGCDKFKWPIEKDRAALAATDRATLPAGAEVAPSEKAFTLTLKPTETAGLPMPPGRAPAAARFAGFITAAAPQKAGSFTLSMSSAVWIDVIQDGRFLRPTAFSGATGCDGLRKTMRFDLAAQPFTVQISGSVEPSVALLMRGTE